MSTELKKQLQDFESQLDAALDALPSLRWASTSALRMASELYEIGAIKNGIDSVGYIDRGYSIREPSGRGRQWLVTTMAEFQVSSLSVAYEGVTASALLEFPQGNWRSSAERQEMIDAFVADGLHPFDVFEHRPPDVVVVDHSKKSGVQT